MDIMGCCFVEQYRGQSESHRARSAFDHEVLAVGYSNVDGTHDTFTGTVDDA